MTTENQLDALVAGQNQPSLFDLRTVEKKTDREIVPMNERFVAPPFTVLDTRQGYWQDRKRAWIALGIESELGRDENARAYDRDLMKGEFIVGAGKTDAEISAPGTSIFDPVLCELAYRWFSPEGGTVLDPFAGGSVRGIVAATLGRSYTGIDLSADQLEANRTQAEKIIPGAELEWIHGDSADISSLAGNGAYYDFILSCPPYGDLEVYSDDPRDLSNMNYDKFREAYQEIIGATCMLLKPNRFACFVVTEIRGKDGIYTGLVHDTVKGFEQAGLKYYNEAVLLTAIGSLPLRTGKQFSAGRKLGRAHQNILVFVKGDPKKASEACGPIEVNLKMARGEWP